MPGVSDLREPGNLEDRTAAIKGSPLIVVVGLLTGGVAALIAELDL